MALLQNTTKFGFVLICTKKKLENLDIEFQASVGY